METMELHANERNVERTRNQVLTLLTKCISDIRKTVNASGLTLRDVGIGVEQHHMSGDSYIVDLKVLL
ncbi:MAG TPA: hypothetical protein VMU10_09295 [Desulfomonilia bacterium]|nr:hypothetical protein [Desulfomonilia bacterium]